MNAQLLPMNALLPTSVSPLHIWPSFQYDEELAMVDNPRTPNLRSYCSPQGTILSLCELSGWPRGPDWAR